MWWPLLLIPEAEAVPVCSTCAYTTVQQALDAPFDYVVLGDAVVTEPFTVPDGRSVVVVGSGYTDTRLSPGNDGEPMIIVPAGATLTLSDMILEGREAAPSIVVDGGALYGSLLWFDGPSVGIRATDAAAVTLDDSGFEDGLGVEGTGISASGGASVTITSTTFARMTASGRGGAVFVEDGELTVTDSTFQANTADEGGAVALLGGSHTITSTTFDGSRADLGGAIRSVDADLTLDGVALVGGVVGERGGGVDLLGGTLTAIGATFTNNVAHDGGHVAALDADVTLVGGSIAFGFAAGDGGAVWVSADNGHALVLDGVSSALNVSGGRGGALALDGADLEVTASLFYDESAAIEGGAIFVLDAPTRVAIDGSDFDVASADRGGALSVDGAPEVEITATAFHDALATFGDGGGASIVGVATLLVHASTFDATAAAGRGGGLHVEQTGQVTVTGTAFCAAEALSGGGEPGRGGALSFEGACTDAGACIVESNLFGDPLADEASVVYVAGSVVTVRNATVIRARTLAAGGGLAVSDSGGLFRLDGTVILETGGDGVVTRNGGVATTGEIVVDAGPSAVWSGNDGTVTEEAPVREERVQLLVVPRGDLAVLPCGRESRIHPQFGLYQAFQGTDFGAYGGVGQVAGWQDDLDGDLAPWVYDCDDADPAVSGFLPELCDNGIDDDCDGAVDGDDDAADRVWYPDADDDGVFSDVPAPYTACDPAPGLRPGPGDDCDDGDGTNFPGNDEICNHEDDDCDGSADEDPVDATTFLVDADGDGFGVEIVACDPPPDDAPGAATGDCDDVDPTIHPDAVERDGDGVDQDCDLEDADGFVAGGACGCDGTGGVPIGILGALALVAQRRRRASGRGSISTSGRAQKS